MPLHRPHRAPAGTLRSLLAYGGWLSAGNVTGPILAFADRFVIGGLAALWSAPESAKESVLEMVRSRVPALRRPA